MKAGQILALIAIVLSVTTAQAQVGNNEQVANPNIVTDKALASLPVLTPVILEKIEAARPLASTSELGTAIGDDLTEQQKTQLYTQMFVPINLNTASREAIMLVPGISKKMAHEFEEYRPYTSLDQFRREIGKYVDEAEVARLEQYVFVPMGLNTASSDDFMTIPGISKKMVHEFEEYRPYKSIEQFRREIGKYVDENEVARLERYIYVDQ